MGSTKSLFFIQGLFVCLGFLLSNYSLALSPGDEVIVDEGRKDINVRATTSAQGELLYQVAANQKGIILKGPIDKNKHRWYLVDWDDKENAKGAGWTAMIDDWYYATGNNLFGKMSTALQVAEIFFTSRPPELKVGGNYSASIIKNYNQTRDNGLLTLGRANKNLSRAQEAILENDYLTAYLEYKYAIVQLNNTKRFFNEAIEIRGRMKGLE